MAEGWWVRIWPYGVVLLGTMACQTRPSTPNEATVLARVGQNAIYLEDFQREFDRVRLDKDHGLPSVDSLKTHRRTLLDDLIDRRLLLAEAEKNKVFVGSDEVEAAFANVRAGWEEKEFNEFLAKRDITASEYKNELREHLMIRAYFRDHVFSRIAVTDAEIEAYLSESGAGHVAPTEEPEKVSARHIVVKTEEQAKNIAREIAAGLRFEDAAMKYSLSPDAQKGGDLGFFARGEMPEVFEETCFGLEVGKVSPVVPSEYGYHLFQVVERLPARTYSAQEQRERIEGRLREEKMRKARADTLARLRAAVKIVIKEERLAQVL